MAETRAAENKLKVFISYSRKDIAFAQRIVAALESRGIAERFELVYSKKRGAHARRLTCSGRSWTRVDYGGLTN